MTDKIYTQADLQAAVAAALEEATTVLDGHDCAPLVPPPAWSDEECEGYVNGQLDVAGSWKSAIRALITPDASAALAARDARMRREGMDRAAGIADPWSIEAAEAIRADMEGK